MADCTGLKPLSEILFVYLLGVVLGFKATVRWIALILWKGPMRVFCGPKRNVRPEVLKSEEYGTHQFLRLENSRMTLHYVVSGPPDKPLMLFIHGFPEFWYSWRHQLKEFSKDYRVVALDMRGYGESDKPSNISDYITDKLVDDVDQLITALGYERCILIGHDWGARVAWCYAAVHPARVERLINICSPHPKAFKEHLHKARSQLWKSWYMFFFQLPVLPELWLLSDNMKQLQQALDSPPYGARRGTFTPLDMEVIKYTFAKFGDLTGPINFYRGLMVYNSPTVDTAIESGNIEVPSLIIHGTRDGLPEKAAIELSSRYCQQLTIQYVEGGSHWLMMEEPQQVNQLIRQFVTKD